MAPRRIPRGAGNRRVFALSLAAGLLLAACSGSAATPTPAPSPSPVPTPTASPTAAPTATPTPTPTAAPSEVPATETMDLTGPAGGAGAVTQASIRCNMPATDGTEYINVLARPVDPNLSVYINVSAGQVTVRYDSGAGSTYVERDFTGTGVTNFDPARGATIDTKLKEVTTTGAHGKLGILTALKGTIDCGGQLPGTSTLTLSGPTSKGNVTGGLSPVNVSCVNATTGAYVSIIGVVAVDGTPTSTVISVSAGTATVYLLDHGFFKSTSTAVATITSAGAHVDADLLMQNPAAGATATTIHMTGDAVCGY